MSNELKGLYKLGGVAFILSGMLFLSRDVLEFMAGPPPSPGADILAWVASWKLALSFVSEVRVWIYVLLGAIVLGVLVVHGWWLPRKGVNGWTAEPRDRYYEIIGLDSAGERQRIDK